MKTFLLTIKIVLLFTSVPFSDAEIGHWCVADPQIPDNVLQAALDWTCQNTRTDCSKIGPNQPCFLPNTIKDHASVVFNSYYQHYKHQGGYCYFNSAAVITQDDPSHGSCHFEYIPDSKGKERDEMRDESSLGVGSFTFKSFVANETAYF